MYMHTHMCTHSHAHMHEHTCAHVQIHVCIHTSIETLFSPQKKGILFYDTIWININDCVLTEISQLPKGTSSFVCWHTS